MPNDARFAFGENWREYLSLLDEERISAAERALSDWLGDISGQKFLDIGSGSGLMSLAARRLGASVVSFDYDSSSVWCTREIRRRYCPDDPEWQVFEGSVLDVGFMAELGTFDVVYSWGVLHHTGRMWDAVAAGIARLGPTGRFFIALYNDQGRASEIWRHVKRAYNRAPVSVRPILVALVLLRWLPQSFVGDLVRRRNPLARYAVYSNQSRGMSPWRDWIDWIGGYPFEVARPDEVFRFLRDRDCRMVEMRAELGWGCNEYLARRVNSVP